jgi:hypothetical protein
MTIGHRNLCEHAEDERSLYKLWDDDLKRTMRRRQVCEWVGGVFLAAAILGFESGRTALMLACILLAVVLLYAAIKYMIDESNVNYLMHQWDLEEAIKQFRHQSHSEGRRRADL